MPYISFPQLITSNLDISPIYHCLGKIQKSFHKSSPIQFEAHNNMWTATKPQIIPLHLLLLVQKSQSEKMAKSLLLSPLSSSPTEMGSGAYLQSSSFVHNTKLIFGVSSSKKILHKCCFRPVSASANSFDHIPKQFRQENLKDGCQSPPQLCFYYVYVCMYLLCVYFQLFLCFGDFFVAIYDSILGQIYVVLFVCWLVLVLK